MSIFGPKTHGVVKKKTVYVYDQKRSGGFIKPTELRTDVLIGPIHGELPILIEWNSSKNQPCFQFTVASGFITMYASCVRGGVATYSLASEAKVMPATWYVLSPDFTTLSPEFSLSYTTMHLDLKICFHNHDVALSLKGSILGSFGGGVCYEMVIEKNILS